MYSWDVFKDTEMSKDIVENYRTMFESRFQEGGKWKITRLENPFISSWSYDMEGHAKKCVERYCELTNRTTQQLYKVSTPCLDDHHFKEEELKSVGEIVKRMLSNCSEMLILGTCWKTRYSMVGEQICTIHYKMDQSLWQTLESIDFHTFIIHVNTNSIAMWLILQNNADWDCFKTQNLQEILRTQNLRQVEHCAFLKVLLLFPISWMCKKQASVSHSSTESEIISLDAGLRMDGIPALVLRDLIVTVLHGKTHQNEKSTGKPEKSSTRKKIHRTIDDLNNVDFISSSVNSSRREALLCIFEDNEAVIKMIIKGRGLTVRHVSWTRRIGCLTESIWIPRFTSSMSTSKRIRRHTDKGQSHTWWVEPSSTVVQH